MVEDPIVAEVRQARADYADRFNHDLRAICRDLQQKLSASGRKVVTFPPKRPVTNVPLPTEVVQAGETA